MVVPMVERLPTYTLADLLALNELYQAAQERTDELWARVAKGEEVIQRRPELAPQLAERKEQLAAALAEQWDLDADFRWATGAYMAACQVAGGPVTEFPIPTCIRVREPAKGPQQGALL